MVPQRKQVTVIDKNGINRILSIVESISTPGVFGIVALNPDGSPISTGGSQRIPPTPIVNIVTANTFSVVLEAKFNVSDRWIYDTPGLEPELYLFYDKGRDGKKNHPKKLNHRRAHMPTLDESGAPISRKRDVNKRLNAVPGKPFAVITEWAVDGTLSSMNTTITIYPWTFLGSKAHGTEGVGSFPIPQAMRNGPNGSEYPATFTKQSIKSQGLSARKRKSIRCCIKLVIRDPKDPTKARPIESDISDIFVIYPMTTGHAGTDYEKRGCLRNKRLGA